MMTDHTHGNDIPLLEQERGTSQKKSPHGEPEQQPIDDFGMPVYEDTRLKKHVTTAVKNLKSRKIAFVKSLIHIPAVATTIGVLTLTFRNVFWEPPSDDTNAILNSLQFAAQLHGSFIVMSLSAILLHVTHHQMSGKRGSPLGFLSSSFQLNSLAYPFRREFTSLSWKYTLAFLLAFVLAMLSGPSSAITMIPRLQFWSVDNLWLNKGSVDFRVYIEASESGLYPETLTAENAPPQCFGVNASMHAECPSYGMRYWMMQNDLFLGASVINKTIDGGWIRHMVGQVGPLLQNTQSGFIASTLSTFLGRVLLAFDGFMYQFGAQSQTILGVNGPSTIQNEDDRLLARYDLSFRSAGKTIVTRKPVVEVQCTGYPSTAVSLTLLHDQMYWPPWSSNPIASTKWTVPSSDYSNLSVDLNSTIVNSSWINIEQFDDIKPSLGALFSTAETINPGGCYSCPAETKNTTYSQYACTIDARWMPTYAFSDSSYSGGRAAIFDANPNPNGALITSITGEGPRPGPLPNVFISESWAKALDVPWIDSIVHPKPTNRTILDTIGQKCLEANTFINSTFLGKPFEDDLPHRITVDPMKMMQCLQVSLSVYLSEALARVQESIPTYLVVEGHGLNPYRKDYFSKDVFMVQNLYEEIVGIAVNTDYSWDRRFKNISKADFADPNRFTEIYIPVSRWGYGYGFQSSKLIYVGVVILLIHVGLCVGYIVWILSKGDYRSAGWDSIGELVSMAMRSGSADERDENVSRAAIMKGSKKWTERFGVREVAMEGPENVKSNTGADQPSRNLVLRRVGDYEGREGDVEGNERRSESTIREGAVQ